MMTTMDKHDDYSHPSLWSIHADARRAIPAAHPKEMRKTNHHPALIFAA
nr:hypothetical protein Q903MT_gene5036 [Picea sitchensis]